MLCHKCILKLYHGKEKRYVNIIQIVWAEAQLKWTEVQWKSVMWKFFLLTMNAVSCWLRRKGNISAQFKSLQLGWHRIWQPAHLERHHQHSKVFTSFRRTYALIQMISFQGRSQPKVHTASMTTALLHSRRVQSRLFINWKYLVHFFSLCSFVNKVLVYKVYKWLYSLLIHTSDSVPTLSEFGLQKKVEVSELLTVFVM